MTNWLSFAVNVAVGAWFVILGSLKVSGLIAGIEGGNKVPFARRLCAT